MLFLLLVVSFLTLGIGGSCWVLLDWLRERRTLREQKTRARLGRILHRKDQGRHAIVARLDVCDVGVYEWCALSSTSYVSIILPYPSCLAAIQPY
jgi:hypothetical protein